MLLSAYDDHILVLDIDAAVWDHQSVTWDWAGQPDCLCQDIGATTVPPTTCIERLLPLVVARLYPLTPFNPLSISLAMWIVWKRSLASREWIHNWFYLLNHAEACLCNIRLIGRRHERDEEINQDNCLMCLFDGCNQHLECVSYWGHRYLFSISRFRLYLDTSPASTRTSAACLLQQRLTQH